MDVNDEFLQEIDDADMNIEKIFPRMPQNLTIITINEQPVYHVQFF
jgi:hypothetical protein